MISVQVGEVLKQERCTRSVLASRVGCLVCRHAVQLSQVTVNLVLSGCCDFNSKPQASRTWTATFVLPRVCPVALAAFLHDSQNRFGWISEGCLFLQL